MLAFNANPEIKSAIIAVVQAHYDADRIIKGTYWENGRGCGVGCILDGWGKHKGASLINHENHAEFDLILGPGGHALARLCDMIFEGLNNGHAKEWPLRFMSAIKPGADVSRVRWQFLHWLLTDEAVNPGISDPLVRDAVKRCADVLVPLTNGEEVDESAALAAWSAAGSAADSVAASAEWSAERSAARSAACAAESAAWGAESAEWSAARSAAWGAESAAESAEWSAAWGAESAAASAAYLTMSNKLVQLLEAA